MKIEQHLFDEIYSFNKVVSTMNTAQKMIQNGDVNGNFLILANEQSNGKGRQAAGWFSPEGGLWFTMALYGLPLDSSLTIFTGIIIHQAILEMLPELEGRLKIKWPNDIMLDGKKLCGILTLHLGQKNYFLVGVGVDTNITEFGPDLSDIAISLKQSVGRDIEHEEFLNVLFHFYAEELPEFMDSRLRNYLEYYKEHCYLKGQQVLLSTEFESFNGRVQGINSKGALLLEIKDGMIQPFYSGSIEKIY
ncbi:MAG: biotin--[acetyl-CoA-carboxylase] ligase [Candidatus Cloacimonetes bacterium]|nr:biotin--[acetyl-CoA-carboxylase] ligase [Candidatus Cloacimonadota bacterium]